MGRQREEEAQGRSRTMGEGEREEAAAVGERRSGEGRGWAHNKMFSKSTGFLFRNLLSTSTRAVEPLYGSVGASARARMLIVSSRRSRLSRITRPLLSIPTVRC